jgi:hypothetical protein
VVTVGAGRYDEAGLDGGLTGGGGGGGGGVRRWTGAFLAGFGFGGGSGFGAGSGGGCVSVGGGGGASSARAIGLAAAATASAATSRQTTARLDSPAPTANAPALFILDATTLPTPDSALPDSAAVHAWSLRSVQIEPVDRTVGTTASKG